MPRQTDEVRKASVVRVQSFVKYVARVLPAHVDPDHAPMIAGALVGTLQIARTLGRAGKGRAMLAKAREALLAQYDSN